MSPHKFNRAFPDNPAGTHLIRDNAVLHRLVCSSAIGPGDLVLEFGAGTGNLTARLARTGARVIAIERNPRFVARLKRRFSTTRAVRVVGGDARTVPLPRRRYAVVANIPFSISTVLLRRLLDARHTSLQAADLLVEWGFAKRVTAQPRDREAKRWQDRYELTIAGRVAPYSFDPAPNVASAHLVIRRRTHAISHDRRRN